MEAHCVLVGDCVFMMKKRKKEKANNVMVVLRTLEKLVRMYLAVVNEEIQRKYIQVCLSTKIVANQLRSRRMTRLGRLAWPEYTQPLERCCLAYCWNLACLLIPTIDKHRGSVGKHSFIFDMVAMFCPAILRLRIANVVIQEYMSILDVFLCLHSTNNGIHSVVPKAESLLMVGAVLWKNGCLVVFAIRDFRRK